MSFRLSLIGITAKLDAGISAAFSYGMGAIISNGISTGAIICYLVVR